MLRLFFIFVIGSFYRFLTSTSAVTRHIRHQSQGFSSKQEAKRHWLILDCFLYEETTQPHTINMKFVVVGLTVLATTAEAFTTVAPKSHAASRTSSTSLNLFGLRRRNKIGTDSISEEEVRSLFTLWNDALATGNSKLVAKRYASDAVLLPTVSDTPRTDFASIKDYFDAFLTKQPQGVITDGNIRIGNGWCSDTGICELQC